MKLGINFLPSFTSKNWSKEREENPKRCMGGYLKYNPREQFHDIGEGKPQKHPKIFSLCPMPILPRAILHV